MIKGLYSAFTAMEAAWKYQDVLANNIANVSTVGFKREVGAQQSFSDILLSQQAPVPAPFSARIQAVVGQIGSGTFMAEFSTDYAAGEFIASGSELDFALNDGFFGIEDPGGQVFYTRDGRFNRDANGDLVALNGYYVLNAAGGHINLTADAVSVASDGTISQKGNPVDQLGVWDFAPAQLSRAGEAYFISSEPGTPIDSGVRQGLVENSNTEIGEELATLLAVQRTYQANQKIISVLDGTLNQAASQLGTFGGAA